MKKEINGGMIIPKFYGIAYHDFDKNTAILYPIPLNLLVGLWIRLMAYLKRGYRSAYDMGFKRGLKEGRKYAFGIAKKQILRECIEDYIKSISCLTGSIERRERPK